MAEPSSPVDPAPGPWAPPAIVPPEPAASTKPAAPIAPARSVVITTPPRRSHRGMLATIGVLVVAGVGVGGFLLLRGDDPVTYSLEVAATRADAAPGYTNQLRTEMLGDSFDSEGTVDNGSDLVRMTMELGASTIEAVVDPAEKVLYMRTDGLGEGAQDLTDKQWVRIDRKALEQAGRDGTVFDQLGSAGRVDVPALLGGARTITDQGAREFRGEPVHRYVVVVRVADVKGLSDLLEAQTTGLDATMPDEITYDLYVTKDNEIRRIVYDVDFGIAELSIDLTQHLLDTAPGVSVPPADDVVDITDLG